MDDFLLVFGFQLKSHIFPNSGIQITKRLKTQVSHMTTNLQVIKAKRTSGKPRLQNKFSQTLLLH